MYTACTSQALESGFMNLPPVANSIALELHNVPMLEPQELKRLSTVSPSPLIKEIE